MTNTSDKEIVDIWKTVIGVQMHFNDISMRIRSMFVTILLALFASVGFLLDKKLGLQAGDYYVQFATVLPVFGILGTYLFYFIDRYWYHRLLVGSVRQGMFIENKYKAEFPELSLTEAIGKESPYEPRGFARLVARLIVSDDKFHQTKKLHSEGKVEFFYKSVMLALLGTVVLVAVFGGVSYKPVSIEKIPEQPITEISIDKNTSLIQNKQEASEGRHSEEPKKAPSSDMTGNQDALVMNGESKPTETTTANPGEVPTRPEIKTPPDKN